MEILVFIRVEWRCRKIGAQNLQLSEVKGQCSIDRVAIPLKCLFDPSHSTAQKCAQWGKLNGSIYLPGGKNQHFWFTKNTFGVTTFHFYHLKKVA